MKLEREGCALAHRDVGTGDPAVVLIHGWATDHTVLAPLADHLATDHRVISVDLRGHGDSDAPNDTYSMGRFADDVGFVIDALGLDQPVVIGHSMGGLVAVEVASRGRASALAVLESPVIVPASVDQEMAPLFDALRSERYREVVAGFLSHLAGPQLDPEARARLVAMGQARAQHVLVSAFEALSAYDGRSALARVRCPVLYVRTGTPFADMPALHDTCPHLVVGQLVGCGHYFPLEVPDQLGPMVSRFLRTTSTTAPGPR